jgi:hypothetical protein
MLDIRRRPKAKPLPATEVALQQLGDALDQLSERLRLARDRAVSCSSSATPTALLTTGLVLTVAGLWLVLSRRRQPADDTSATDHPPGATACSRAHDGRVEIVQAVARGIVAGLRAAAEHRTAAAFHTGQPKKYGGSSNLR